MYYPLYSQVVWLTQPDAWSPCATYAATKLFAGSSNARIAQRFFNIILLEKIRDDLKSSHKLNFHYHRSLKRACSNPGAFYKGLLLPLCEEGSCTVREAGTISSAITLASIPVLDSSVALMKLAQMRYSVGNSVFIKTLVSKKYALPMPVVAALVRHFAAMQKEKRTMPVVWQQCLLAFIQNYKAQLNPQEVEQIKSLMRIHSHGSITPCIRKALFG